MLLIFPMHFECVKKEEHTYISGELLEGVKHIEAVEVNDPSC